ncbi:MAG: diadenylate cyclase CdaA [Bacteroidales bacterium]|nr:diadenylate cyclase CdaA [Bacteroidales bacterium]MDD3891286.1 diadenylate cyclase CdaA [Bacteroidales bacterium]
MDTSLLTLFISIRILDIIDILLVALLLYQIYMLIRGTVAINIFVGIFILYIFWLVVRALNMELLSGILGQIIGVGVIALIIVFQQEIRRFLLLIGSRYLTRNTFSLERLLFLKTEKYDSKVNIEAIIRACRNMIEKKIGAIIVITIKSNLQLYAETGDIINAETSSRLIESIFFKNSPMHDGAMIINDNLIYAVRCILPLTERTNLPASYGLRHRAAIGISDITDALVIVISEETSKMAFIKEGEINEDINTQKLRGLLEENLINA